MKNKKFKLIWPCGGNSGLGCGTECYGMVQTTPVRYAEGKPRAVFCPKCRAKLNKRG